MDEIRSSIDGDKWEYGRTDTGILSSKLLKSAYFYIYFDNWNDVRTAQDICMDYLQPDHYGHNEFIQRDRYIFFQRKEDRDLIDTLRLLY